jgi:steroid 5-alpha reductase family enzyme
MERGVWRYTRQSKYFGDFAIWSGFYVIAAVAAAAGAW